MTKLKVWDIVSQGRRQNASDARFFYCDDDFRLCVDVVDCLSPFVLPRRLVRVETVADMEGLERAHACMVSHSELPR